jgi:hypothetical protein
LRQKDKKEMIHKKCSRKRDTKESTIYPFFFNFLGSMLKGKYEKGLTVSLSVSA